MKNVDKHLVIASGLFALLLGAIVLLGWYTHNVSLIQISSAFVPMQYNTALGFMICGIGLLTSHFNKANVAVVSGIAVALIGAGTLNEYIFNMDLMIDQLFMEHYITTETSHPGRMALNTALCFSLSGLALISSLISNQRKLSVILGLLGALIFGLGFIAFIGYFLGPEAFYGWGQLTQMAIHTALGFIILGSGFFAFGINRNREVIRGFPQWVFVAIGIVLITIVLSLWQALNAQAFMVTVILTVVMVIFSISVFYVWAATKYQDRETIINISNPLSIFQRSIQWKIIIYTVIPIAIIYLVFLGATISSLEESFSRNEEAEIRNQAAIMTDRLDKEFNQLEEIAGLMAQFIENQPDMTLKMAYNLVRENVAINPLIFGSAIAFEPYRFESNRRLFSPYAYQAENEIKIIDIGDPDPEIGYDYTSGEWEWYTKPRDLDQKIWTAPYFDEGAGNIVMSTYSVPFYRQGEFLGIATVDIALETLFSSLGINEPRTFIITREGQFVHHPNVAFILNKTIYERIGRYNREDLDELLNHALSKETGFYKIRGWDIDEILWVNSAIIPSTNWIYISAIPESEVLSFIRYQWHILGLMLTVTLLIMIMIIWFSSGLVTKPIRELHNAALKVSDGDYDVSVKETGKDELGKLASVFNNMTRVLSNREEDLEREVAERTRELHQSQIEITKQNEIIEKTLENMGQGIMMTDSDLNILVYNDQLLDDINVTREQAESCQTFEDLVRLNYKPDGAGYNRIMELAKSGKEKTYESVLTDGKILEIRQNPLADGGLVRTYTDITERRQVEETLRESRQLLEGVIDNSAAVIYVKDYDGRYLLINPEFETVTKTKRENVIGHTDHEIYPREIAEHVRKADLEVMESGELVRAEEIISEGNDTSVFLSLKFPLFDSNGKVNGVCGISTDITEQKRTQEELTQAKQAAETATETKATFLASMSHEIRTPMNGVIGMVDLLRQTELSDDQKQMLQTISDSGQSLLTIINDILDFSKIEAGMLDFESIPLSLTDVVEGSAQTIATNATKKGLRLITYVDPELPQFVTGDPVRVRQILINLGGNAIKFTEEGDVVIRAERVGNEEEDKVTIRFSVIDQGIGISEEGQTKLFQAFSQAESSTTRQFGGTGLGLTICKRLTEMMGGEIGVKSQLGEGSEFYATLPFSRSGKRVLEDKVRSLDDLRILLISSHPSEEAILRRYLEYWHAEVTASDELSTCLEQCMVAKGENKPYDIVVIGPQWAREKQFEVRAKVTTQSTLPDTRFICLLKGKRRRERLDLPASVCLDVDPLRRAAFLSAVAVAAGRASPEVHYEEEVEDLKATVKAPTVDEALAQGTLILVAEDNPTNRDVIGRQLNLLGYACEMAEDGKLAMEAWRNKNYGILLTDCHMPNMDGFELTDAIRKDEKDSDKRAPIIAITANALQGEAERCLAAGMDDYMSKPINMKELRDKLRKWMPHASSAKPEREDKKPDSAKEQNETKRKSYSDNGPIDERALKDMFGDDDDTFKEILNDFIVPSQKIIEEIKSGWESRSAEAVKQAAHKLKSSARSVGANELADLCLALETASKQGEWTIIDNGMQNLDPLMAEIESYISNL